MKVQIETLEPNTVEMDVEVDAQEFAQAVNDAYRKLVAKATIPGFRRGKAPRHIFERFVGKAALYEEAFEIILPGAYERAVEDSGIEPVDQPSISISQMEEGKPLQFKAKVTVKPEVNLGDYTKVAVPRTEASVTTEEIEAELKKYCDRHSQLVPVDGPVEKGHFTTIDFEGFIDGEPFFGNKEEDYPLLIGSGRFIPGFEDGIIGMTKGETRDVVATFPESYPAEELRGKQAVFKATVKEIRVKETPELTDDFVKQSGLHETVEELRNDIENRLLKQKQAALKRSHENEVLRAVTDLCSVDIPEVMVERKTDEMLRRLLERLESIGLSLDQYLRDSGRDVDDLRKQYKEGARAAVKTDLVLEAIAKKEGIEATAEEMDTAISNVAARYREKPEVIREMLMKQDGLEGLREGVISDKTISMLANTAAKNAAGVDTTQTQEVESGDNKAEEQNQAEKDENPE